ncbi:MAG: hypothetical protein M0C28_34510 [Candidatus Moduliflexus flocculans]|nr:hypothetical protein [Candidatus Moduliflexus flocculans]
MNSTLTDLAEPSESLLATTVLSARPGRNLATLSRPLQLDNFRNGLRRGDGNEKSAGGAALISSMRTLELGVGRGEGLASRGRCRSGWMRCCRLAGSICTEIVPELANALEQDIATK